MSGSGPGIADLEPLRRAREQKAWNWYDWANSAFYTTTLTVLFAPYLITVAGRAAGCGSSADESCTKTVNVLGLHLAAGSLPFYLTSFATIVERVPAPRRRCLRRPLVAQEVAPGRLRLGGVVLRRPALPHARRPLAAGRGRDRRQQHPRRAARWSATTRSWSTSPPRTSATASRHAAGPGAISVAACSWRSTWSWCSGTPPSGSTRSWRSGSRCSRLRCGGPGSRSSRCSGCATTLPATSSPSPAACSTAASASCSRRCARCAATR